VKLGPSAHANHRTNTRTLAALRVIATTTRNDSTNTSLPSLPSPSDRNPGLAAAHELKILKHGQQKSTKAKDKIQIDATKLKFALLLECVILCGPPTQTLCLALSTCTLVALSTSVDTITNTVAIFYHFACHPWCGPEAIWPKTAFIFHAQTHVMFLPSHALVLVLTGCKFGTRKLANLPDDLIERDAQHLISTHQLPLARPLTTLTHTHNTSYPPINSHSHARSRHSRTRTIRDCAQVPATGGRSLGRAHPLRCAVCGASMVPTTHTRSEDAFCFN
jgi:hypothetical protein